MNGKIKSTDMKVNWYDDIIVIFVSSHKRLFYQYSSQPDPSCSRLSAYTGVWSQSGYSGSNDIQVYYHVSLISFSIAPLPFHAPAENLPCCL